MLGDFKLIRNLETGISQLFNLATAEISDSLGHPKSRAGGILHDPKRTRKMIQIRISDKIHRISATPPNLCDFTPLRPLAQWP